MEATITENTKEIFNEKTAYLANTSSEPYVVADLNIAFAGIADKFDSPVRAISREKLEGSTDLQLLIADGTLEEVSYERMQDLLREYRARRTGTEIEADFEGNITGDDITPEDIQVENEKVAQKRAAADRKHLAGVASDPGQSVGDLIEEEE